MTQPPFRTSDAATDAAALLRLHPTHVIYKHSPTCGLSAMAAVAVSAYEETPGALPVTMVDVLGARPLSNALEAVTGVRHESPQVLIVRDGEVRWSASHRRVTAEALAVAARAVRGASRD